MTNQHKFIIVDLDGTIADDRHRLHLIDRSAADPYERYHELCLNDAPMNLSILHLCDKLDILPAFVTSRPEKFRKDTTKWLGDIHKLPLESPLIMRPNDNKQSSPQLKHDALNFLGVHNILCAFDDRRDVVEMYTRCRVPAIRVSYELGASDATELSAKPKVLPTAPEILRSGAKTFEERNATYGETYSAFGKAMDALFPNGLTIKPGDVATYNLLGVFVQIMTKTSRYANSLTVGGHVDSAHDSMVYSAMLEHLTRKGKQ